MYQRNVSVCVCVYVNSHTMVVRAEMGCAAHPTLSIMSLSKYTTVDIVCTDCSYSFLTYIFGYLEYTEHSSTYGCEVVIVINLYSSMFLRLISVQFTVSKHVRVRGCYRASCRGLQ